MLPSSRTTGAFLALFVGSIATLLTSLLLVSAKSAHAQVQYGAQPYQYRNGVHRNSSSFSWTSTQYAIGNGGDFDAVCPSGQTVVAGGYNYEVQPYITIAASEPVVGQHRWRVSVHVIGSQGQTPITVYADCTTL